jgi:hypothetical protein
MLLAALKTHPVQNVRMSGEEKKDQKRGWRECGDREEIKKNREMRIGRETGEILKSDSQRRERKRTKKKRRKWEKERKRKRSGT